MGLKRIRRQILVTVAGVVVGFCVWAETGMVGKPAPELANTVWINSEPLRIADLHGKVILLEFWTYG